MSFKDVPIPKRMRRLQRDDRGYPVPFVIVRDKDGEPIFTANDSNRTLKCRCEYRCPVCGGKLKQILWFCGGPLSAFHPHGVYNDEAMHYECMEYALQVCPYLSMPNYMKRLDLNHIDPAKLPEGISFYDPTMIAERPRIIVAVCSTNQIFRGVRIIPQRPYIGLEYWNKGQRMSHEEGEAVLRSIKDFDMQWLYDSYQSLSRK